MSIVGGPRPRQVGAIDHSHRRCCRDPARDRGMGYLNLLSVFGTNGPRDVLERAQRDAVPGTHVAQDVLHQAWATGACPSLSELGDELGANSRVEIRAVAGCATHRSLSDMASADARAVKVSNSRRCARRMLRGYRGRGSEWVG
jgi:hypothetical protein